MSIYGQSVVKEGFFSDILKNIEKNREIKNKRSKVVDTILNVLSDNVQNNIKNGIGISRYNLFNALDDSAFIKGKSDTWKVYFEPAETNKDVNELVQKISNDIETKLNLDELLKKASQDKIGDYRYQSYDLKSIIKNSLFDSKLFSNAITNYWSAVEKYSTNEDNIAILENSINDRISNMGFSNCILSVSTDRTNYKLIITVSLKEN